MTQKLGAHWTLLQVRVLRGYHPFYRFQNCCGTVLSQSVYNKFQNDFCSVQQKLPLHAAPLDCTFQTKLLQLQWFPVTGLIVPSNILCHIAANSIYFK